jgi:hypothetical protein
MERQEDLGRQILSAPAARLPMPVEVEVAHSPAALVDLALAELVADLVQQTPQMAQ